MLTVKMEYNKRVPYNDEEFTRTFDSLDSFKDWIFAQYGVHEYSKHAERYKSDFTLGKYFDDPDYGSVGTIRVNLIDDIKICIAIHMVSDERGVLFTDGKYTYGKKHASKEMREFFADCEEKKKEQPFTFVA